MGVSTVAVHRCAACSNGTGCDAGSNCAPMHWHTHATGVHRTHARTSTHFRGQNGAFQHTRRLMVPWTMAQHRAHVQSGLPVPTAACARLQAEPVCPPLPCAHPCQADPGMRMQRPGNSSALATVGALAGGDHREARTAARSAGRAVTTGTTAGASLITMMTAASSMVATRVADSDCCPHQWIVARGPETRRGERVYP